MENMNLILLICILMPLSMILFIFKGQTRTVVSFLMLGIVMCLLASEINGIIIYTLNFDRYYATVNIIPIVEELLKALPVLVYAYLFKPSRRQLIECALVMGIGFAILENCLILTGNISLVSLPFALVRGFGTGMMHGLCTMAVGFGIGLIRTDRRLAFCGTFALLTVSVMYHSAYNCIVQSEFRMFGIVLPLITFALLIIVAGKKMVKLK